MEKVLDNLKAWTILKRNTLHKGDPKLCAHNHIDRAQSRKKAWKSGGARYFNETDID